MGLEEIIEAVHDRETFLGFVDALLKEIYREQGEREINVRTAAFLEAAQAATVAHEGRTDFLNQPSWQGFATFLYLGLIYE